MVTAPEGAVALALGPPYISILIGLSKSNNGYKESRRDTLQRDTRSSYIHARAHRTSVGRPIRTVPTSETRNGGGGEGLTSYRSRRRPRPSHPSRPRRVCASPRPGRRWPWTSARRPSALTSCPARRWTRTRTSGPPRTVPGRACPSPSPRTTRPGRGRRGRYARPSRTPAPPRRGSGRRRGRHLRPGTRRTRPGRSSVGRYAPGSDGV